MRSANGELQSVNAERILDTVQGALVVIGPDLVVRSVNRRFSEMFGLGAGAVERKRLDALGVGVLSAPALVAMLTVLDEAHPAADVRLRQYDEGRGRRTFQASACRIDGTELVLLALEDVTVREEAQLAVRQAELGFREILMAAGEAILMTDPDRRPFFANRAAAELFGYRNDEILASTLDRLLPGLDATRMSPPAEPATWSPDVVGRRKDGSEFPAQVVVSHAVREERPVIVVFVTDVTYEREAQERAQRYQEMLQRQSVDAALAEEHERRRLALALHDRVGQALALAKMKLASLAPEACESVRSHLDEATAIIDDAIDATRTLTFDLSPPVLYDLGLAAAVQWLIEDFERKHGVEVELCHDGAPLSLDDVTSSVLFRSVRELLMNVVKHSTVKHARVSLARDGELLTVEVADGGAGFDPNADRTPGEPGFGLLSIRQQVEKLGGQVEIESRIGAGTRVELRVPLRQASREWSRVEKRPEPGIQAS